MRSFVSCFLIASAFASNAFAHVSITSGCTDALLLRNKGQTDINIELYGEMTWSGWQ